ncbi:MAG: IclR family transcriptional regulator [Desulfosarcinaceae bacterium]|nr:IclR family transcriptional regulator [Desulfosarcinaceae bacterium]
MSKGKYYFSKSLEKGLKILALFNRDNPAMTQSEIAKILGLNMTSTYRYINTLVEMGYLEKDAKSKEIRPAIHCLLFCANLMRATDHQRLIRGVVDRIHAEHNITIDVAFAVDDTLVRIYHRGAEETLTYALPDFSKNCLHNTALGKAWLSSLPMDLLEEKVKTMALAPKTDRTIVDRETLLKNVAEARDAGYAMSEEEYLPGLITISAPLFDPQSGRGVGAVCFDFSVLEHSAADVAAKFAQLIQDTATQLSELLPPEKHRN